MSRGLRLAPALARASDGGLVIAVEHVADATILRDARRARAIDEDEHARRIRVFVFEGEPDRLPRGIAVPRGAVRQEALVAIGPEQRIERIRPLLRPRHHDDPMAILE